MDEELRIELLARRDEDQRVRLLVEFKGREVVVLPDDVAAQLRRVDESNTRWLGQLLSARGWPGHALAGEDGAQAAWLLAQHADHDPVLQRAFLDALRAAVMQGEAGRAHLAYLEGRGEQGGLPGPRAGCGSMPIGPSFTGLSSLAPAQNSGQARSKTPSG